MIMDLSIEQIVLLFILYFLLLVFFYTISLPTIRENKTIKDNKRSSTEHCFFE